MAELHIIGSLQGASDFPSPNLTCKYSFQAGDSWKCIEGEEFGQTHVDCPEVPILFTLRVRNNTLLFIN